MQHFFIYKSKLLNANFGLYLNKSVKGENKAINKKKKKATDTVSQITDLPNK